MINNSGLINPADNADFKKNSQEFIYPPFLHYPLCTRIFFIPPPYSDFSESPSPVGGDKTM